MLFRFNPLDLQKHALIRKKLVGLSDLEVNQRLLYKVQIELGFWDYQTIKDTESFKKSLYREYYGYLINPDTGSKPESVNLSDLFNLPGEFISSSAASFEHVGNLDEVDLTALKKQWLYKQYTSSAKYWLKQILLWGTFLFVVFLLIYSVDRFYQVFYINQTIDWKALTIQCLLILISICCGVYFSSKYDAASLILFIVPVVVVIIFAELCTVIKFKIKKKHS